MARLAGKVALVTGAASGIGEATVRAFVDEGARVVVTDRNDEAGARVAADLGGAARYQHLDVTREDDWRAAIATVEAGEGRLDALVHNAGGGVLGSVEATSLDQWRFVQRLNVESVFLGTQAALPLMKASGAGSIVVVSSVAGLVGDGDMAAYCAAKGAARMLSKSIALHLARTGTGLRCNSVHPSFVDTPLVAGLADAIPDPRARERLEKAAPLRRLGEPAEVAAMIVYLASDESRFVTGSELVIDGGMTAR